MSIARDILAALSYYDLFDYPLKKREIFLFLGHADARHEFENALDTLVIESLVFRVGEFYSLQNNYSLAERRIIGNGKAALLIKKAQKASAIISWFPFVRAVGVSGSLSKNYADDNADVDFFIITAANRLWVARTMLHMFKKITFVFNRQHLFCMNYFIDESAMEIIEKNIYTATEIATLIPMQGNNCFEKFFIANSWTKKFLPNNYMRISTAGEIPMYWLKRFFEFLLSNRVGNVLDDLLMKLTTIRWQRKTRLKKRNTRGMVMGLHASRHFAKPDPTNFQFKLLRQYENNLEGIVYQYEHPTKLTNELF